MIVGADATGVARNREQIVYSIMCMLPQSLPVDHLQQVASSSSIW